MNRIRGFTLIEILIVVAIIGGLAAIIYPISRTMVGKSREAACLNQLRSLGVGLQSYLQEHNQIMPDLEAGRASKNQDIPVLETVLLPYMESPSAFKCPADHDQFDKSGSSYLWDFLQSGKPASKLSLFGNSDRPDKIPLIADKESWHPNGTNYLYADLSTSHQTRFGAGNRNSR